MGDKNRISHDFDDGTLERIMWDLDRGRIEKGKSWSATHPAYYGTSIQQKSIKNRCEKCPYYGEPVGWIKKVCKFPWEDPREIDVTIKRFLPCKGEKS